MSDGFVRRYILAEHPEYFACADEFRFGDNQMMLLHIDVDPLRVSPSMMKRLLHEWQCLRSCTRAPFYGIEPEPDDTKWERFVGLLGFQNTDARVQFLDGHSRRLFVSYAAEDAEDESKKHAEQHAVERTVARPDAVLDGRVWTGEEALR